MHTQLETNLSITADFDGLVVIPRVLQVHTRIEFQAAPSNSNNCDYNALDKDSWKTL